MTACSVQIPKLIVRVRFPSPAPRKKPQLTPLSIGGAFRSTASHNPIRAISVQLACWHGQDQVPGESPPLFLPSSPEHCSPPATSASSGKSATTLACRGRSHERREWGLTPSHGRRRLTAVNEANRSRVASGGSHAHCSAPHNPGDHRISRPGRYRTRRTGRGDGSWHQRPDRVRPTDPDRRCRRLHRQPGRDDTLSRCRSSIRPRTSGFRPGLPTGASCLICHIFRFDSVGESAAVPARHR